MYESWLFVQSMGVKHLGLSMLSSPATTTRVVVLTVLISHLENYHE